MIQLAFNFDVEEWRTIPFASEYSVSSRGRVMRVAPDKCGRDAGKILKPRANQYGYDLIDLNTDTGRRTILVSRLVLFVFCGPPPEERSQAAHGDGVRSNNAIGNLRWATPLENTKDRILHGTHGVKLGPEEVIAIRAMRSAGHKYEYIAERFGVTHGLVGHIINRRIWKHDLTPL